MDSFFGVSKPDEGIRNDTESLHQMSNCLLCLFALTKVDSWGMGLKKLLRMIFVLTFQKPNLRFYLIAYLVKSCLSSKREVLNHSIYAFNQIMVIGYCFLSLEFSCPFLTYIPC